MNPLCCVCCCLFFYGLLLPSAAAQNDKVVVADDHLTTEEIEQGAAVLYRIRFQNTGSDTAAQVVVQDTIDPRLDLSTLEIIDSSHPYTLVRGENAVLQFYFDNICLPHHAPGTSNSTGYLIFTIKPQPFLAPGQVIYNRAKISFDSFSLMTNPAPLWIDAGAHVADAPPPPPPRFRVIPNPNYGQFELQQEGREEDFFPENEWVEKWWITNQNGRSLGSGDGSDLQIAMDEPPPGLYWIYIQAGNRLQVRPFMVIR